MEHVPLQAICVVKNGIKIETNALVNVFVYDGGSRLGVGDGPRHNVHGPALEVDGGRIVRGHKLVNLQLHEDSSVLSEGQETWRGVRPSLLQVEVTMVRPRQRVGLVECHVVEPRPEQCAVRQLVSEAGQTADAGDLALARQARAARVSWVGDALREGGVGC